MPRVDQEKCAHLGWRGRRDRTGWMVDFFLPVLPFLPVPPKDCLRQLVEPGAASP
jgi:hypothetical protein